ncbi:hypothetical protein BX616_000416 [Lobosporangium transversale]|uniref:RlpA-like double-psi beta-barrel-protein domain-containing protein-containing protein n=1 Tax=Lobosporangium transversale TaxID=64571 RepID=A0A1Y2GA28_9FUNG|nr:RlpA-like double-psi beta-barrel-protein domain-containing protein-containing protein [Lobosporangium transversale]KAF9907430.1 hypothetical protein BX616_000416 [Lobosporangium transversale]ORZ05284.1 RlpA-like double-psi beta-barrel-protein domain-containing protein-containing protein [Lobosporangium transversale]|eukprot:XP_021876976.1 RlpA-like double-psi beta-barrel-protein domain-containing protein-containing protein [Lobosporangium transversale]
MYWKVLIRLYAISTSAAPIKSSSSSSTDDIPIDKFSPSVKHSGKATWFTHTYGACNIHWDGYKEPTVALNAYQMGAASWGNPACDRRVRVTNKKNGKSVEARIVDKCPGDECAWGSLDLSPAAFKRLGELDTGILNIEWQYLH